MLEIRDTDIVAHPHYPYCIGRMLSIWIVLITYVCRSHLPLHLTENRLLADLIDE
jgi:hypothetical protein